MTFTSLKHVRSQYCWIVSGKGETLSTSEYTHFKAALIYSLILPFLPLKKAIAEEKWFCKKKEETHAVWCDYIISQMLRSDHIANLLSKQKLSVPTHRSILVLPLNIPQFFQLILDSDSKCFDEISPNNPIYQVTKPAIISTKSIVLG